VPDSGVTGLPAGDVDELVDVGAGCAVDHRVILVVAVHHDNEYFLEFIQVSSGIDGFDVR